MDLIENHLVFSIEKALSIPLTICFFLALKGVGVIFGEKKSTIYLSPFIGLGIIYTFTLIFSVMQPGLKLNFLPFLVLICGGILYYKKIRENFFRDILKISIIFPLVFYAAFVKEFSWDDYTHWLFYVDYLFENNHLPIKDIPYTKWAQETYPYGVSLIRYLPNTFLSELNLNISALLNILFLTSVFDFYNLVYKDEKSEKNYYNYFIKISLIFPIILLIFILHNTRVVTNAATDLTLALTVTGVLFYLNQFFDKSFVKKLKYILPLIFLFIAIVSIKQVGIFILTLIFFSFSIILISKSYLEKNLKAYVQLIKDLLFVFFPLTFAFLIYLLWNFYCLEIGDLKNTFNPVIEKIYFEKTFDIVLGILEHLKRRPYILIFLSILIYMTFKIKKNFNNKLLIYLTFIFSINLFLFIFLSYLTIFSGEARRAVSFDRYLLPASITITCLTYFIFLKAYLFQLKSNTKFFLSITLFLLLNFLVILNPAKFVRANVLHDKKILYFLNNNIIEDKKFILVDEINWGFRGNLFKFKLRKILDPSNTRVYSTNEATLSLLKVGELLELCDGIILFSEKITKMRLKKIANYFQIVKPKSEVINKLKVIIIKKKDNHDYISYNSLL